MSVGVGVISVFDILSGGGRWKWEGGRLAGLGFVWLMCGQGRWRWMDGVLNDRQNRQTASEYKCLRLCEERGDNAIVLIFFVVLLSKDPFVWPSPFPTSQRPKYEYLNTFDSISTALPISFQTKITLPNFHAKSEAVSRKQRLRCNTRGEK